MASLAERTAPREELPVEAGGKVSLLAAVLAAALVALSLGWLLELPRLAGLTLFVEQPLAAAAGLSLAVAAVVLASGARPAVFWLAVAAGAALLAICLFIAWAYPWLSIRAALRPAWLVALSTVLVVGLLVALWRTVGAMIALVVTVFVGFVLAGPLLGIPSTAPTRLPIYLVLDPNGLLGLPLRVAVEIVIPFVLFGELLRLTGGGDYLTGLATAIFGRYRGGSAKAAVGASALFGTISGNAVSNVVGTGIVTIPMMKRTGFRPAVAGAVEAAASTGGQLLPPVMGSAAFVMADYLRVPYSEVLIAAAVPALLYFAAIFVQVDRIAARDGIRGLAREDLPPLGRTVVGGLHFLVPFVVLFVAFIAFDTRPQAAVLMALAALVVVAVLRPYEGRRLGPRMLLEAVVATGLSAAPLVLVTAAAGLIIGVVSLTGLGFSLAGSAIAASGGNAFLLLVFVALVAIVFGMGMPTVAVYVVLATVLGPALVDVGIPELQAHLFILYFGMMSMLTPPVALASITAAKIAGTDLWRTSFEAVKLAWVAYLIPFLFAFSPALVLRGTPIEDGIAAATAFVGTAAVSVAAVGHFGGHLSPAVRIAVAVLGLGLVLPPGLGAFALVANILGGAGLVALVVFRHRLVAAPDAPRTHKKEKAA